MRFGNTNLGADRAYLEKPSPEFCNHCDGQKVVGLAVYRDCRGIDHVTSKYFPWPQIDLPEIPCPRCGGNGAEPEREE